MWKHKTKFKGKLFQGSYQMTPKDRVFQLTMIGGTRKPISLESWQEAIKDGWIKVK